MTSDYWSRRRGLEYYKQATDWVKEHTLAGDSVIDIGGGVTTGCRYLAWLPEHERTSVELRWGDYELDGVRVIESRFEDWEPDKKYDIAICLQCAEHVEDPWSFIQKIRSISDKMILSLPYKWGADQEAGHLHDPIDDVDILRWVGREPTASKLFGHHLWRRWIGLYL